ncbi:putative ribonuclease H-like domain-containing protein [Tanacetum coccineum]
MVPRVVLMKSSLVSINTTRQNTSKPTVLVNTARQVKTAHTKKTVNDARPMSYFSKTPYSTVKRPINNNIAFKNSKINQKVNTVRGNNINTASPKVVVNVVKGRMVNAVKASTCWDMLLLEGTPKEGKSQEKCAIKTGNLDFENVYFVRELKFNLFSVSQMCDKKNSVLFNDTECIVLSLNFKLIDESQVLLKVPRKNNMYSVDLKKIIPKGGLSCLFAKSTSDKSKHWHRRLGHLNFKTMNKLVKGNLVRGLPSKLFKDNQTCVACQKGKQHKASFVTDEYSRFTWVFFLATKDETSIILKSFITGIKNLVDHKVKAEAVNTACYVQNRVLVVKPHNKTPYELFHGSGPDWLFDIDALTRTMNFEPIIASTQSNGFASTKASDNADDEIKPLSDDGKKVNEDPGKEDEVHDQKKNDDVNSTNKVNTVSSTINIAEEIDYSSDDKDVGVEADMNNLDTTISVSPIPTTRIHKDHPFNQVTGDLQLATQTRKMLKNLEEHGDFLYGKIKEEVYVCQPLGFEDPDFPDRVYKMSSIGEHTFFLGLQVKQKEDGIFISQDKYAAKIFKKFGFTEVKTAKTPMETQKPLLKDEDGEEVDVHMYRSMIGSLIYLRSSRPDIMFTAFGIQKIILFDLEAYTDSDYAGVSLDMKSTTGGCQFLGCRLISWQCKKQTVVANSTIEAKYIATANCYGQVL